MKIILTHQNADFDAIASMLGVYKLDPSRIPVLPTRHIRNVTDFLALYRNGLPFRLWEDINGEHVTHVTLTDTQAPPEMRGLASDTPLHIIEHHPLERKLKAHESAEIETLGAITTLLVERIRHANIGLTTLEATLLMLGIYNDTGSLSYGGTTTRDMLAAAWLLEKGAVLDTVRRFLSTPLDEEQQELLEQLLRNTQDQVIQGYPVTLCIAETDHYISGINTVTHRLNDIFDPSAIFVLVTMPRNLQLVCRSRVDAVDVGHVARHFGGGGHPRAAAAAIYDQDAAAVAAQIWSILRQQVQPSVRVGDLMSHGVQAVQASDRVGTLATRLRRIGHEGYPVLDDNERLVGLLTRRDADRAMEHGLTQVTVQDIMQAGNISLKPDDSISMLEQLMVSSGWGQIPVTIDDRLAGIVTRTDLIKHWAQTHPQQVEQAPSLDLAEAEVILGHGTAQIITHISEQAQQQNLTLYMVGGVVRDLILSRSNLDIDFVIEGDAIAFAQHLHQIWGGDIHIHRPFGTAKWHIDASVLAKLNSDSDIVPEHIDFASARNEFYAHPTALPTVYNSSIKLDLGRRDFTINTLAVQLSPLGSQGRILDYYGGVADLENKIVRVLHSLSFVDDPTRILRAVRFSERLGFLIESRSIELMQSALPMLRRITGERIRNEITLLLQEQNPERGLLKLEALKALEAFHPAFHISRHIRDDFRRLRQNAALLDGISQETDLMWYVIMARIEADQVAALAERLLFSKPTADAMVQTTRLIQENVLASLARPSEVVKVLDSLNNPGLLTAQIILTEPDEQAKLHNYQETWRHVRAQSNGHTLEKLGLKKGPIYREILTKLRDSWLDGEITSSDSEMEILRQLIAKVNDD